MRCNSTSGNKQKMAPQAIGQAKDSIDENSDKPVDQDEVKRHKKNSRALRRTGKHSLLGEKSADIH